MPKNYEPPHSIDIWDAENSFYLNSPASRLAKLLAHYELFKMITHLPGAIVECGVYKGASLCRFAGFRAYLENNDSRKIIGMDAFGAFPTSGVESEADKKFIQEFESSGGHGISAEALQAALDARQHTNVELVKGDVFETIPDLLERYPHLRIALLHLDMDVFEPTQFAIDKLFPHMTPGGLVVFDDYNSVEGATIAADKLCKDFGLSLEKLPFYNVPAFVRVNH